jgi:hypothetical protein
MFSIIQNHSGKSSYYTVSPIAHFTYGMAAGLNISGYVEAAKNGLEAFGIIEDDQDNNNSTCINDEVKVWTGDIVIQTDQFEPISSSATFSSYYKIGAFLTVENGKWKPLKNLNDVVCGIIMDYPNSTNGFLLTFRTCFPNSAPTLSSTYFDLDDLQLDLDFTPAKTPKVGTFGGAICDECGAENEYLNPMVDYVCKSCRSYKEM